MKTAFPRGHEQKQYVQLPSFVLKGRGIPFISTFSLSAIWDMGVVVNYLEPSGWRQHCRDGREDIKKGSCIPLTPLSCLRCWQRSVSVGYTFSVFQVAQTALHPSTLHSSYKLLHKDGRRGKKKISKVCVSKETFEMMARSQKNERNFASSESWTHQFGSLVFPFLCTKSGLL